MPSRRDSISAQDTSDDNNEACGTTTFPTRPIPRQRMMKHKSPRDSEGLSVRQTGFEPATC